MPHLFDCWEEVSGRLRSAPTIALFLDFDGTLVPIEQRPENVELSDSTRERIGALSASPRFRIWIVSGRLQADLRARVGLPGVGYVGLHGAEGAVSHSVGAETRHVLACIRSWIGSLLLGVPGAWLEDKGLVLAVHYRATCDEDVLRTQQMVEGVVRPFERTLKLTHGKKVLEVAPRELTDKGAAVLHELSALPKDTLAIYVGDDQVDEPAFTALAGGITIRVGRTGRTHARYRLSSVKQVEVFLAKLREECE